MIDRKVIVIGAGLAGSEAAWQLANFGVPVKLVEMRPVKSTPAHHTGEFGELVCSNSFGALSPDRAAGLLQKELRIFKSLIVQTADKFAVPAGGALAVDRSKFSIALTDTLSNHPLIEIKRFEQLDLPSKENITILATGPLTSDELSYKIQAFTGIDECHFLMPLVLLFTEILLIKRLYLRLVGTTKEIQHILIVLWIKMITSISEMN